MSAPAKLNLAKLAEFSAESLKEAMQTRLAQIDLAITKALPYLGALRHFAKARDVSLNELVEQYSGTATRKAFEDSKPYADILGFFGHELIPSAAFDAIPRAKARELVKVLPNLKKDTAALEKVQGYLTGPCKFRDGWIEHVMTLIPEPAPKTPQVPTGESEGESEDTTAPANITPLPAPVVTVTAPAELTLEGFFDELRALTARLPARQLDTARANLARAVNSPEAWKTFCQTATATESAPANVIPLPVAA